MVKRRGRTVQYQFLKGELVFRQHPHNTVQKEWPIASRTAAVVSDIGSNHPTYFSGF